MISHANEASLHCMDPQESVTFNTLTKLARTLFGTATTRKTLPVGSRFRPRLECLEERAVPAVYNVTNGNDAGVGSLRAAITTANGTIGIQDEIHIDPNLTISLMSELLAITDNLIIVGGGQSNTVIRRAAAAPAFRIFTIIAGSNVQMHTLTIQGGDATQYAGEKDGGGILNRGNLLIWRVTVQD